MIKEKYRVIGFFVGTVKGVCLAIELRNQTTQEICE